MVCAFSLRSLEAEASIPQSCALVQGAILTKNHSKRYLQYRVRIHPNTCKRSRIWNINVATNTIRTGMATASSNANILFDPFEEAPISSLDTNRTTRMIAIMTPPTPLLMIDVNEEALEAALDVIDEVSNITFMANAITQLDLFILNFTTFTSFGSFQAASQS